MLICCCAWAHAQGLPYIVPGGVKVSTDYEKRKVVVETEVFYPKDCDVTDLSLDTRIQTIVDSKDLGAKQKTILVRKGKKNVVRQEFGLKEVSPWRPDFPYLYLLKLALNGEVQGYNTRLDKKLSLFGFPMFDIDQLDLKPVEADMHYVGFDGQLPVGEVKNRVKMAVRLGYNAIMPHDSALSEQYIAEAAQMGVLYLTTEPLQDKSIAAYPNVVQVSPTYLASRALKAAAPLPEPSMTMTEPLTEAEKRVLPTADVSLLKGADMNYIYRVNIGGPTLTDSNGHLWESDSLYLSTDSIEMDVACKAQTIGQQVSVMVGDSLLLMPEADQPVLQSYRTMLHPSDTLTFAIDSGYNYCVEVFFVEPTVNSKSAREFSLSFNGVETIPIDIRKMVRHRFIATKLGFTIDVVGTDRLQLAFPKPEAGHPVISAIAISTL